MNAVPLFDTFMALFVLGLLLNISALVTVLVVNSLDGRRSTLPRAIARLS